MFSHDAQGATDAMRSRVDGVTEAMDENLAGIDALQQDILRDKAVAEDLLANGKAAQQVRKCHRFTSDEQEMSS